MTGSIVRLFIERRFIPQDGKRYAIADGHVERQDAEARAADDRLAADLVQALAAKPVADAGHRIRLGDQHQGGRSCT